MSKCNLTNDELLKYAIENGIIDPSHIQEQIEMNERRIYLQRHTNKVWQSKDGKYYTYLPDKISPRGKRLVKKTTMESLEDAIVEFYKEEDTDPYMEDVFSEWIENKLKYGEIKKQSYDRYKTSYNRFFTKDVRICQIRFRHITENMLEDFIRTSIAEKQLSQKSWGDLRLLINGMFKYAKKKNYTDISISQFMGDLELPRNIFTKKIRSNEECVFTQNEVSMIRNYIYEDNESLLNYGVLLGFCTGLRVGELSTLKWMDIENGSILVRRTEIRVKDENNHCIYPIQDLTKTPAGSRKVIITEEAEKLLRRIRKLNPFGEYIFEKDGSRIRSTYFSNRMVRICRNLGIRERTMHKARATYGTTLYDAQVPKSIIISQMGHTDIRTTEQYYYYDNKNEAEKRKYITYALEV